MPNFKNIEKQFVFNVYQVFSVAYYIFYILKAIGTNTFNYKQNKHLSLSI